MKKAILLLGLSIFIFYGCASTQLASYTDPNYINSKYNKIMVVANTENLLQKQSIEQRMLSVFSKKNITVIGETFLIPPTRSFTKEEVYKIVGESGVQAILFVNLSKVGVEEVYIPQTGSSTKTQGNVSVVGGMVTHSSTSTTTNQGGYTMEKPYAEFNIKLVDVKTGETAWIGDSFTGGSILTGMGTVTESFSEKIVETLMLRKLLITTYDVAMQALEDGDYEKALNYYNEVVLTNPNYAQAYFGRGTAKYNIGDTLGACEDWKKAKKLGHKQADHVLKIYCK